MANFTVNRSSTIEVEGTTMPLTQLQALLTEFSQTFKDPIVRVQTFAGSPVEHSRLVITIDEAGLTL